jgi:hypothetical protein
MRVFQAFVWFLRQTVAVGGLGYAWFGLPFLALLLLLLYLWRRSSIDRRWLWLLLMPPAQWILTGLLGAYYWIDWAQVPVQRAPGWVLPALQVNALLFFAVGLVCVLYLKGARWFAGVYWTINLYFMLSMNLLAAMAVTGDWL